MGNSSYTNLPAEVREADDALVKLALNLRWSWNHSADELWGRLDPELWELTQNPWLVLQTVSHEKLQTVWRDATFCRRVADLNEEQEEAARRPSWFQTTHASSPLHYVAYFSMEFMLSEALPIYSGGLGNVAGDQLKAASDLGVPVIGIGLLYQQGYFRQEINAHGAQQEFYPFNAPSQLPIRPLREKNGEWLRLSVALPGVKLWVRAWKVSLGKTMLYLLDSNDPANPPAYRSITSELYGGGPELRLKQEVMLGIGGWRLLQALGLKPEVCHLNEGHAAFAVLDRAFSYMNEHHQPFDVALAVTRAGNIFTTHTAVDAGFDRFAPDLIEMYFRHYAEHRLGIRMQDFLALGRQNPDDASEPFNMAYLAMRGSSHVNGVSRLHGEVSRRLFQPLFPRWPQRQVPVQHVTNGVHVATWECPGASSPLWSKACGIGRWMGSLDDIGKAVREISDEELWELRTSTTRGLIDYTRKRLARQLGCRGASPEEIEEAGHIFDPDTLTLGFARRFATYKRPNLLLQDPERLLRILTNPQRPAQLILAGKAHPQDQGGKRLIQEWHAFLRRPEARRHVVFLSDYDMLLTQQLVRGVDVWINTPRRPWEASGTSGMKVLVNGGLNLSEIDGWWAEAYTSEVGWAIGDGREHGDNPAWDAAEADALYTVLEREVAPAFYDRNEKGIPECWVAMMRESMARLVPHYSANRTVREYTEEHYIPAAQAYSERAAENGQAGLALVNWRHAIASEWDRIRFGGLRVETEGSEHHFEVQVYLDGLDPDAVRVELYAEPQSDGEPAVIAMNRNEALAGAQGGFLYSSRVPSSRPAADYTPRIVPYHPKAFVPLEASQILWQR
ncbi:MAG TPA: alpha-glucan family phosphorylase [Bryobacteraceae bacterium]|nr:alpha-glucan family phosphorylase [Bryobacteraceae bacterium]